MGFFSTLGLEFGKYKNPADQILKLASSPQSFDSKLSVSAFVKKI